MKDIIIVAVAFVIALLKVRGNVTNPFIIPVICIALSIYMLIKSIILLKKGNKHNNVFLIIAAALLLVLSIVKLLLKLL